MDLNKARIFSITDNIYRRDCDDLPQEVELCDLRFMIECLKSLDLEVGIKYRILDAFIILKEKAHFVAVDLAKVLPLLKDVECKILIVLALSGMCNFSKDILDILIKEYEVLRIFDKDAINDNNEIVAHIMSALGRLGMSAEECYKARILQILQEELDRDTKACYSSWILQSIKRVKYGQW